MTLLVYGAIAVGLLLLMIGAVVTVMGNQQLPATATADQQLAVLNYRLVWGPAFWDVGMFFFLGGLIGAVLLMEQLDPFVRLFLIIVVFVAVMLILSQSLFLFHTPP